MAALCLPLLMQASALAQSELARNNLLTDGSFDAGGQSWLHTSGGGTYFYTAPPPNPDNETNTIASFGWWTGYGLWQNSGAIPQSNQDYVLSIRARNGDGALGGFNLAFQDPDQAWATLTNRDCWFPDEDGGKAPGPFRVFWLPITATSVSAAAGHAMGIAVACRTNPAWGQTFGWLHVDWVQLAPARPMLTSQPQSISTNLGGTFSFTVAALGAVTNSLNPGVLQYQWFKAPSQVLANATNQTYTLQHVTAADAGDYYVVVQGSFGSTQSSNATLNVLPFDYVAGVDPGLVLVDNFEGWGTSLCWWAKMVGGYANRQLYASLAFTQLQFNIVRYNIGGGENPSIPNTLALRARIPGFQPSPGVWDWSADANQRWMLRQAVALGANRVVAFANSPPWWMTVSGSVTGSASGSSDNLQTGYETAFASYLATVVSNLTVLDGVRFDLVTPMNEPSSSWWVYGGSQEGCHMGAAQQARMVKQLRHELDARGLSAGIDAPEDNDEQSTLDSLDSYDATALTNVTCVASHTYSANNPAGLQNLANRAGKRLWISEYGDGDASGLPMARRILDDLTQSGASAWIYWQMVDNAGGWGLIYNALDGSGNTSYTVNEKFYILWQFSHFIHRGFSLLNVDDENSLAAYDPVNHSLVVVTVNDSTNSLAINYDLRAFATTANQVTRWRTSASERGVTLPALGVINKQFAASALAQSVTTHVISGVTLDKGPRAAYPLEGTAQDATGHGNDGTVLGGVTFAAGKLGKFSASFDGATGCILIPRSISNSFTITCWVKTSATGGTGQWWAGEGMVDGEVAGTTDDFGLALVGDRAALGVGNPDTTVLSISPINDNQWHHLAATRDAVSGRMELFVDGQMEVSAIGPVGAKAAPGSLRLGSVQTGADGGFFAGVLDEVELFGQVLDQAEIVATMNHAPVLANPGDQIVMAGRNLTITNSASDPDLTSQSLTWGLIEAPAGVEIDPTNGLLTWRPAVAQSPSTNRLSLVVTDNGTPSLSSTQSFSIAVLRPGQPQLSTPACQDAAFSFQVSGDAGPDYVIEVATNLEPLALWLPLSTNFSSPPEFLALDPAVASYSQRFYRVRLGP